MPTTTSAAIDVANDLEDDGVFVVSESEAKEMVKNKGLDAPWARKMKNGFERMGWRIDDEANDFYEPDGLSERVRTFSNTLRSESRTLISTAMIAEEVARQDRLRGEWGEIITEVLIEEGWKIDQTNGVFFLPAKELVSESSLSYYLLNSFSLSN